MKLHQFPLNLAGIVSLGIGSVVGAGIFALLGQVILLAGSQTYYAFVIAGAAALFSGYSYARLAGTYHTSGGLTEYFHIAFPQRCISGTLSLIYVLTSAVSISMMAKSFGIYAADLIEGIPPLPFWINTFAVGLIVLLAILNMLGAADVGRAETFLVAVKLSILVLLVIFAFSRQEFRINNSIFKPSTLNFLQSIGVTFFAYAGYGVITNAAADVHNPRKTVAKGIYLTLITVIVLYLCLAWVVLNFTPASRLNTDAYTAVALVAKKLMGSWGYGALYLAAVIAFITGINATFFSIFRINRSLAQQKILPSAYKRHFWKHGTYGNLITTGIILLATVCFDFTAIVNLSSAAYLVSYLGIFAANWRLRKPTDSSPIIILIGMMLMMFIFAAFVFSIFY